MSPVRMPSARQLNVGLVILRVVVGVIFAAHGGQKLFVFGFDGVTGAFGKMGLPMPGLLGPGVALLEFLGGLALVFGVLTRLAAFGLAVNMLGAILLVHLRNGLFLPSGFEFALALFAPSAMLALTGAGDFSIDGLLSGRARRASS